MPIYPKASAAQTYHHSHFITEIFPELRTDIDTDDSERKDFIGSLQMQTLYNGRGGQNKLQVMALRLDQTLGATRTSRQFQ